MKLSLRIIFIICIIFKVNLGYTAANPITDIIIDHHQSENNPNARFKSIVDKSDEEKSIAQYHKLNDLFADPKPNEIVLIRGKLLQNLNNNDLFVFRDDNTVSNINIPNELWKSINEETYVLNKDMQFLVKVIVNNDNKSVSLQAIKIFLRISDTDNYILTAEDKKNVEQLNTHESKKISTRTISDTEESEDEELDSVEDEQNKGQKNLYGVTEESSPATVDKKGSDIEEAKNSALSDNKEDNSKDIKNETTDKENTADSTMAQNEADSKNKMPEDKPAEDKKAEDNNALADEPIQENLTPEEPEPEIYNKVPEEEYLKSKEIASEDNNVLSPEEIQKLEQYDKNPPSETRKKSFLSFGK